ncbi:hypothetical protein TNCT_576201 [Trichonephila clavata]|uniref:Uncharacterized protein n=1 Tax=Trichonephila clavata TaxID=2740835 RepID=A0A8X6LMY4_TRICU|nr:hypothetical protein TNCT_576201 [Trichonephila clavata]
MRVAMLTVWRYLTRCRVATFTMASSKDLFEAYLSKHGYLSLQNGKILFRLWKPNGVQERADLFGFLLLWKTNGVKKRKDILLSFFFCSGYVTVSTKELDAFS